MEPPLGQISFFLLALQFARNQMVNLKLTPYTDRIMLSRPARSSSHHVLLLLLGRHRQIRKAMDAGGARGQREGGSGLTGHGGTGTARSGW